MLSWIDVADLYWSLVSRLVSGCRLSVPVWQIPWMCWSEPQSSHGSTCCTGSVCLLLEAEH